MKEIWKDVVGYEGLYEVSNKGGVRTHKYKTTYTKKHGVRHWKQRYLKNKTPNGRDVRVALWKDGKPKDFLVHRLVAFALIPMIEGKNCINHIDGNPKNNNVDNLEWCNHSENNRHALENGLIDTQKAVSLTQLDTGIKLEFKSMAKADKWLDRSIGYTSYRLQKNYTTVVARDNTIYKIEKLI
ncbi:NUMOD4 domain-containing protein [Staphylococcus chromogenes]|uniref:NUMOD4 domain-containing protein n=1 Tax=Staphylococcus chromogenes TaxID=46126 RepID=UPI000D1D0327|nr:NUMOD4 domain-containing protein [Staphylococcus chromogenes]PTF77583.1 HNH endonuclease [Staphylococcus chromogenes]